jgi:acetyltransferase-like isoleucine patch superfamily enzyme
MVARATAKAQRSSRIEIGDGALAYGRPHLRAARGARIVIGDNVSLVSTTYRNPLGINHPVIIRALLPGAEVVIGEGSGMSGGSISAAISVRIGAGTLLGANVTIIDTDSHPVNSLTRATDPIPPPQPEDAVSIGDNVLIGTGAMILRGVTIGDNCVVGAGAVVRSSCNPGTIVVGNPARAVGLVDLGQDREAAAESVAGA